MDNLREVDTLIVADDAHDWDTDAWANDPPELVISLGDLDPVDMRTLRAALPESPIVGVLGNHDWQRRLFDECGGTLLTGTDTCPAATGRLLSSRFLAVGGCVRYKDEQEDVLYTQDEYTSASQRLDTSAIDLLITHCPPAGVNDDPKPAVHQGIDVLRRIVESSRPRYILHGHTHPEPHDVVTTYPSVPETEVVYVYGHLRRSLLL